MGINKKRIAERQKAAELAKKQEKQKQFGALALKIGVVVAALAVFITAVALIVGGGEEKEVNRDSVKLDTSKTYYADIAIKDYGTITVELDSAAAPITVQNFVELAKSGFYNGLTFHRIMEGFMMQGGDPEGNGTGGSDKDITGEFASNGWNNPISHKRGVISMARSNDPNSASSQFFIMHQDATYLDGNYAAFGKVTSGMDVVDKICTTAKPTDSNGTIPAAEQPVIESITIREK